MPDVREVYEMITNQKPPEPGALERQQKRQVRSARNKRIGAFAFAAMIGLVAVAVIFATRGGRDATTPANQPTLENEPPTVVPQVPSGPYFLDLGSGEMTPLPESLAGGYSYVASPDGMKLAYSTSAGGGCSGGDVVKIANIDGTEVETLPAPEGFVNCGPRWSPDGTKLVYQQRFDDDDSVGNLFVLELSSGRTTQITDLELTRASWWFLFPSFSREGNWVMFHLPRSSSKTTEWDVWSVPVTGGEPTLTLRNAYFPMEDADTPGPDIYAIQFLLPSASNLEGRSIMTGHPQIADRETLVEAKSSIWWPTLSPAGTRIAYQDGGSIYVVDLFSRESTKVAEGNTAEWLDNDTLIVVPES